jgi:hypothetical protein
MSLTHGAIAARRSAVAIPIRIAFTGLERSVADALDVIQAIQASVAAGLDAPPPGGRCALARVAARGMALRSILRIVAVGVDVGVGGGSRVHLEEANEQTNSRSSMDARESARASASA